MSIPAEARFADASNEAIGAAESSIDGESQGETWTAHAAASCRALAAAAGLAVALLGCIALGGWLFDVPILKSLRPDWATMKANAAIGLVLAGTAVWLLASAQFGV